MEELEDWKTSTKLKLTPFGFDVKRWPGGTKEEGHDSKKLETGCVKNLEQNTRDRFLINLNFFLYFEFLNFLRFSEP